MPRAHRYFVPNQIWHITHRCHKQEFLLKFARDRKRWMHWLFEAKKRFGLCVLNYVVTSNHIHLLVLDTSTAHDNVIAKSMQLIAGRTAQEYNLRKSRKGAFWEDRYHATAIDTQEYLMECLVYIDLNMVRAGVVQHPGDWIHGGYIEIQNPPERYSIIDMHKLIELTGYETRGDFRQDHRLWIESKLETAHNERESKWVDSLAVGSKDFIDHISKVLGVKAKYRTVSKNENEYLIKENVISYNSDFI